MKKICMLLLLCALLTIAACTVRSNPRPDPGPQPAVYDTLVIRHLYEEFGRDNMLRNTIVQPPVEGTLGQGGRVFHGWKGVVTASVRMPGERSFSRKRFCYFIYKERVIRLEEKSSAVWCQDTIKQ